VIRPARPADVPAILRLIRDLAEYERAADEVHATEELLHAALFDPDPRVHAHIAEHTDGSVAGFALWFVNFSTWLGRHGIYLEDLYVRPDLRGFGYGRALLSELAAICAERGYPRLQWWVLDWNESAQGFYRQLGARPMAEWTVWRVAGEALDLLGASAEPSARGSQPPK
jgi:GNAT superfamily N-acetyltransferase